MLNLNCKWCCVALFYAVGPRLLEADFALISQVLGLHGVVNSAVGHCHN